MNSTGKIQSLYISVTNAVQSTEDKDNDTKHHQ